LFFAAFAAFAAFAFFSDAGAQAPGTNTAPFATPAISAPPVLKPSAVLLILVLPVPLSDER
jgi:hypothetical protein